MASSTWKRPFGYWNIHSVAEMKEVLNKTSIKLVDHRPDRAELTMKSEWIQGLKDIGLNVTHCPNKELTMKVAMVEAMSEM